MMTQQQRWLQAAVVIPLLGLGMLVARAEMILRSGPSFRIPIKGYDPRDLLSGHYLQYSFDFDWRGESTCGPRDGNLPTALDPSCCVCLSGKIDATSTALARQVACDQVDTCAGWLSGAALMPPLRFFVPERQAAALEETLREHHASLKVTCGPGGQAAFMDLYLGGKPWRDVIDDE